MLAVANGDKGGLESLKVLLLNGANFSNKDYYDNSLLHIAALNNNNKILDWLLKNLKIGIFDRNKNGETALNICQTNKN